METTVFVLASPIFEGETLVGTRKVCYRCPLCVFRQTPFLDKGSIFSGEPKMTSPSCRSFSCGCVYIYIYMARVFWSCWPFSIGQLSRHVAPCPTQKSGGASHLLGWQRAFGQDLMGFRTRRRSGLAVSWFILHVPLVLGL